MSLSAPQQAAVRGLADLVNRSPDRDPSFDLASIQNAAAAYPAGTKVAQRTIDGLRRKCVIALDRRTGRYGLTEAGRTRLREGLR